LKAPNDPEFADICKPGATVSESITSLFPWLPFCPLSLTFCCRGAVLYVRATPAARRSQPIDAHAPTTRWERSSIAAAAARHSSRVR
jgi:hypothetical protein